MHYDEQQELNSSRDVDCEDPDPLWTVEDVSAYLRLEPDTVRTMAREGKLPAIKLGRVWRFNRQDVRLWVKNSQI